jgi:16S rRNA (guanine966-N2)-methyltransferase
MSVRIVAGKYKNRRLQTPKEGTRPTLERVREALFSILGNIADYKVVDFYSGSGALGLEALSRGAREVLLVESDRQAADVIRKNVAHIGAVDAVRVIEQRVEDCRKSIERSAPIDLVLADPPWAISGLAFDVIPRVVRGLLSDGAWLVLGHASKESLTPAPEGPLVLHDRRDWGDSALSFFQLAQ